MGTPIAGILMKRNIMSRRGIAYVGYTTLSIGLSFRTGDFGESPMLWMSIIS